MDAIASADISENYRQRFIRRHLLAILLTLALVLRLAVIPIMGFHHPDELWQYWERAHKLVFGFAVDTWEFRAGIRTWIIPVFIAPFMWLGDELSPGSMLYIYVPKAALAVLSLSIVWAWWKLGSNISRTHAIVAAFVAATWIELIYFSARPLSEPVSMALFFAAAAILLRTDVTKKLWFFGGLLLGLAFAVRFQLAPALLCFVLCTEWRRLRLSLPWIIAGGLAALALDGIIDFAAGEVPFRWIIENFRINFIEDKSSQFGRQNPYSYVVLPIQRWNAALGPIIVLAAVGARRFPGLALTALIHVVAHSIIPHKEFRFVLLSFEIIIFLAAIGTADGIKIAQSERVQRIWLTIASTSWAATSLVISVIQPMRGDWESSRHLLQTLKTAGEYPNVCGLATYELKHPLSVAYTYYHRPTPIFGFKGNETEFRAHQERFNVVIAHSNRPPGGDYVLAKCTPPTQWSPPFCVYHRPGTCGSGPASEFEINQFLARLGG